MQETFITKIDPKLNWQECMALDLLDLAWPGYDDTSNNAVATLCSPWLIT